MALRVTLFRKKLYTGDPWFNAETLASIERMGDAA
jgi:hypothetical protein